MPDPRGWTARDLPDLADRTVVVTGASSGIGLAVAAQVAEHGARVTLAVRSPDRGRAAADGIRRATPRADVTVEHLDLASLASVRDFADRWSRAHAEGLDVLVNNAGVMAVPRRTTADGFELQFGTNHLGHFALTGLLLPALVARPRSRVVTVSSGAHRMGHIDFDDLMGTRRYNSWAAYAQSKLANLLFTSELHRRLDADGIPVRAVAAHPGYAATNLQRAGLAMRGAQWLERPVALANRVMGQSAQMGALPVLFAATAPGLPGDSYVGPDGVLEQRGHPRRVDRSSRAKDRADARRLWAASEDLTGMRYPLDAA